MKINKLEQQLKNKKDDSDSIKTEISSESSLNSRKLSTIEDGDESDALSPKNKVKSPKEEEAKIDRKTIKDQKAFSKTQSLINFLHQASSKELVVSKLSPQLKKEEDSEVDGGIIQKILNLKNEKGFD